jgi:radical SAM superfamily enzyme YgiQ (UPF0313 family)
MFVGVESFNRNTLKAAMKHHNNPTHYVDIIRLCNEAGIRPHFSNIIGFPEDDEDEIQHHLEVLKFLRPSVVSFYILTPIPGTEQYDDFRKSDWITEKNLDRFDASFPTWTHPNLSHERLLEHLYNSYISYYGFLLRTNELTDADKRIAIFSRYSASQRMHPMSGGVDRLRMDGAQDYAALRRSVYDIDLAPLPDSLPLSIQDENMNRDADWREKPSVVNVAQ